MGKMSWSMAYFSLNCQSIVLMMRLHRQCAVFASLVEVLKYCLGSCDWRDRSGVCRHSWFRALASIDSSTASKSPNRESPSLASGIDSARKMKVVFNLLTKWQQYFRKVLEMSNNFTSGNGLCTGWLCTGDEFCRCIFLKIRSLFKLWSPGNGMAEGGNIIVTGLRAFGCSGGFLYNGFANSAISWSENCSAQSQTGRNTKRCYRSNGEMVMASRHMFWANESYTNLS